MAQPMPPALQPVIRTVFFCTVAMSLADRLIRVGGRASSCDLDVEDRGRTLSYSLHKARAICGFRTPPVSCATEQGVADKGKHVQPIGSLESKPEGSRAQGVSSSSRTRISNGPIMHRYLPTYNACLAALRKILAPQ